MNGADVIVIGSSPIPLEGPSGQLDDFSDLKQQLQDCLEEVEHEGSFSTFQHHQSYLTPGLHLRDYGSVGLPLSARDAEGIATMCQKSSNNFENANNTPSGQTWELDHMAFACRGPAWSSQLDLFVQKAIEGLGIQVTVKAQRNKLILFGPGPCSSIYNSNDRIPGSVGTLVVCLPSPHSGGDISLVHGGNRTTLTTSPTSEYDLSVLAWYTDVAHRVEPIASGYRLCLTYDLVPSNWNTSLQNATRLDQKRSQLESILEWWAKTPALPDQLVFPLEDKYTKSDLSLDGLKGSDAAKGRYLENVCSKCGFYWLLGNMLKSEVDECGEKSEEELAIKYVVTPSGRRLQLSLNIEENQIIAEDHYDRDADSESCYDPMEEGPVTNRWHDTVLILLRKERLVRCINVSDGDCIASIRTVFELLQFDQSATSAFRSYATKMLLQLSASSLLSARKKPNPISAFYEPYDKPKKNPEESAAFFLQMIHQCEELGQVQIIRNAFEEIVRQRGWSSSEELVGVVAQQIGKDIVDGNNMWQDWFFYRQTPPSYEKVMGMRIIFARIQRQLPAAVVTSFEDFKKQALERLVKLVEKVNPSEIDPTLQLYLSCDISAQTRYDVMIPVISKADRATLSSFLKRLGERSSDESLQDIVKVSFERILSGDIGVMRVSSEDLANYAERPHGPSESFRYARRLLELFRKTVRLGLAQQASALVTSAFPQVQDVLCIPWQGYIPVFDFVDNVLGTLERYDDEVVNSATASFIQSTLTTCVEKIETARPSEPTNWTRDMVPGCPTPCEPCQLLNQFLADPHRPTVEFSMLQKHRRHMEGLLDQDFDCRTEAWGSPHTLIITKTNRKWCRLHQDWVSHVATMYGRFTNFQRSFALKIIGPELVQKLADKLYCHLTQYPGAAIQQNPQAYPGTMAQAHPGSMAQAHPGSMAQAHREPVLQASRIPMQQAPPWPMPQQGYQDGQPPMARFSQQASVAQNHYPLPQIAGSKRMWEGR